MFHSSFSHLTTFFFHILLDIFFYSVLFLTINVLVTRTVLFVNTRMFSWVVMLGKGSGVFLFFGCNVDDDGVDVDFTCRAIFFSTHFSIFDGNCVVFSWLFQRCKNYLVDYIAFHYSLDIFGVISRKNCEIEKTDYITSKHVLYRRGLKLCVYQRIKGSELYL